MHNFEFFNPVKILFGKGQIARLGAEIPRRARILMTYGGGSIKANGVYEQVRKALEGRTLAEFGGIEPNPKVETLLRAVELARGENVNFLLAVGGGSVLDGTKFIAAAVHFRGDPWDIVAKGAAVRKAVPLGVVLTLPATGSEMNPFAVISNAATGEKLPFMSPRVFPRFSVLDPEVTFSLPRRQISNGIVDAFAHVLEQYLTFPVNAPLQDRLAEAILLTLVEEGPKTLADPSDYDARANLMWCATLALNTLIAAGVPEDWSTHMIGHELTALHGLDHGQTLAIVWPAMMEVRREAKRQKLLQYAERVWKITEGGEEDRIAAAIARTRAFFEGVGVPTRLSAYGIGPEAATVVAERLEKRGWTALGERQQITPSVVRQILQTAA